MERLLEIARKEKIFITYARLRCTPERLNGLYIFNGRGIIILDKDLPSQPRLHKCVLAEEIGHHMTAPTSNLLIAHTSYTREIEMSRDERRALQWATNFLIPDRELVKAVRHEGLRSCYELAEYFDVTKWFMLQKLQFLQMRFRRQELKVRGQKLYNMELCIPGGVVL